MSADAVAAQVEEKQVDMDDANLDPESAVRKVLRTSLLHDGLARGLHEAVKALDRREAHLCILAKSCNEPAYTKLITALCKEHSIPLFSIAEGKVLGEWAGLCKYNERRATATEANTTAGQLAFEVGDVIDLTECSDGAQLWRGKLQKAGTTAVEGQFPKRLVSRQRPVKIVGCSCVVVKSWGEETHARTFILNHLKSQ